MSDFACRVCGDSDPPEGFVTAYGKPRRLCRACGRAESAKRRRAVLATPEGRERFRAERRMEYWRKRNKDPEWVRLRQSKQPRHRVREEWKARANRQLQYQVRRGAIVRPDVCEECGKFGKTEAHHPDYQRPLDVLWLCTACHGQYRRIQELELAG